MKTKAMTSILALAVVTVTVALAQERFDIAVPPGFLERLRPASPASESVLIRRYLC